MRQSSCFSFQQHMQTACGVQLFPCFGFLFSASPGQAGLEMRASCVFFPSMLLICGFVLSAGAQNYLCTSLHTGPGYKQEQCVFCRDVSGLS